MASTVTLEGVKKAVFFPFRGEKWGIKVLIGTALCFGGFIIPIVPFIPVFGYISRIMNQIIVQDEDPQMPEWNDWGTLFKDGIKLFGAFIIYLLPGLLLTVGGYILFLVLDFSLAFSTIGSNPSTSNPFPMALFGSAVGMFAGMAIMLVGVLILFITAILIPPALGNLIAKGDFGAAFRIKDWWQVLKANLSGYILAVALAMGLFYLLYFSAFIFYATIILIVLVPFVFAFIIFVVCAINYSLYAVAYRDGIKKLAKQPA